MTDVGEASVPIKEWIQSAALPIVLKTPATIDAAIT